MGPISSRLFLIAFSFNFILFTIGCQSISPQQPQASASPTPAPSPASFQQPKFLFASGGDSGQGEYRVFAVDPSSGALQPFGVSALAEGRAKEIRYEPVSSTLYVSNSESALMNLPGLLSFHFDKTSGVLTANETINSLGDWSSAASPDGKRLYINGFQKLSQFSIDATSGALTAAPSGPLATDSVGQWMLKMHPSGRLLYGTGMFQLNPPGPNGSNVIDHLIGFTIDSESGTPSAIAGFPRPEQLNGGIAIHPSGSFIVAAGGNVVYSYSVDPTSGSVQLVGSAPFDGRNFPNLIPVFEPLGRYVYLCCAHNQLFAFQLDRSSGQLTPLAGFPMNVTQPSADPETPIAISGSYLFLSQGQEVFQDVPSIAVFKIQNDGTLTAVPGSPFQSKFGYITALAVAEQ